MLTFKEPLELSGVPGSPYTRKMLALLRYRRLCYRLLPNMRNQASLDPRRYRQRPQPRIPLLPTFYARDEEGAEHAVCDSTPVIRQLEAAFSGREVIPADPVLSFLNYLLEDYADEWLTKAMFHYRWNYAADIHKAGEMLPRWSNISGSDHEIGSQSQAIRELQISRLRYVGSTAENKDTLEDSFKRFLHLFDKHLTGQPFMFGKRPSSADFAIYGQLTCLALFDPTPQALILETAPRLYAWTEVMEDLSGLELLDNDWISPRQLPDSLTALLDEVGRLYIPYLLANAAAVAEKQEQMAVELDGKLWKQQAFPYQAKCLAWIRESYEQLPEPGRDLAKQILENSGISL